MSEFKKYENLNTKEPLGKPPEESSQDFPPLIDTVVSQDKFIVRDSTQNNTPDGKDTDDEFLKKIAFDKENNKNS